MGLHGPRLLDLLFHFPMVNVRLVEQHVGLAFVTANKLLKCLDALGIVEECAALARSWSAGADGYESARALPDQLDDEPFRPHHPAVKRDAAVRVGLRHGKERLMSLDRPSREETRSCDSASSRKRTRPPTATRPFRRCWSPRSHGTLSSFAPHRGTAGDQTIGSGRWSRRSTTANVCMALAFRT